MKPLRPAVGVCLLSYNAGAFLDAAIDSVLAQTYPDIRLVVVDNASDDDSRRIIDRYADRVSATAYNDSNRGYAAGMNQGIRMLSDCDVVVPMNCDVVLAPDHIEVGVALLAEDEETGILSGPLVRAGTVRVDAGALALRLDTRVRRLPEETYRRCFKVNGAAPLIRRSVLAEIASKDGGMFFDETYDTYREDIDMAARVLLLGRSSRLCADLKGEHLRSASSSIGLTGKPSRLRRNILSGRYRIALRYYPIPVAALSCLILLAQDLLLVALSVVRADRALRRDVVAGWSRILSEASLLIRHRRRWGVFSYRDLARARMGAWSG